MGIQWAQELRVQPWLKLWQKRKILRGHLMEMNPPTDMSVEEWFTATGLTRWQGPAMTKTQKHRDQRLEVDDRNGGVTAQWQRPNPRWERPTLRHPVTPKRHDQKAGGPTRMPPRKTLINQSVAVKPTEEVGQRDLDAHLKDLEAAVRRRQETPRE